MKKILVIGMSSILGGVETYIYNLIKNSDKSKYDYHFLIIGDKKSVFEDEINKLFNDKKGHFFYCPNLKNNFVKGWKWLNKFYKDNHFDYIYMNTCTCAKFLYCIPAFKFNTKLISHSHSGSGASKINNGFFRIFVNMFSFAKFSCSDVAGEWLYGRKVKDFIVVPNGVDTERFKFKESIRQEIREELKINSDDVIIGHVGRFYEEKNHNYFINLALKLPSNFKFLLIGEGGLKDEFISKVKDNNLSDRFFILPASNEIERYYNAMDLFAMPSLYEGLPIVSVEAQTNGLNCVFSANVSKNSDLSGHCSFIPLDNIDMWIDVISNLDYTRYDGVKEIKSRKFDINSTVKMVEEVFEK